MRHVQRRGEDSTLGGLGLSFRCPSASPKSFSRCLCGARIVSGCCRYPYHEGGACSTNVGVAVFYFAGLVGENGIERQCRTAKHNQSCGSETLHGCVGALFGRMSQGQCGFERDEPRSAMSLEGRMSTNCAKSPFVFGSSKDLLPTRSGLRDAQHRWNGAPVGFLSFS